MHIDFVYTSLYYVLYNYPTRHAHAPVTFGKQCIATDDKELFLDCIVNTDDPS